MLQMDGALMLKLSGAVLIIASSVLAAFSYIEPYKSAAAVMLSLKSALLLLRRELCDRLTTVPELVKLCAGESEDAVKSFFEEVSAALSSPSEEELSETWKRATQNHLSALPAAVSRELAAFGCVLGSCDEEAQEKAIICVMSTIDCAVAALEGSLPEKKRLLGGICVSISGFVILILM